MGIFRVTCPQCRAELDVKRENNIEKTNIKCPNCGCHILVRINQQPHDSSSKHEDSDSTPPSQIKFYHSAVSVYVFGVFNNGYTQHPNDSLSEIFKKIYSKSKALTQIAIHREDNLMYYCYIRKIDNKKYIGFSIILTGKYLTQVKSLFTVFEEAIENLCYNGTILNINISGKIHTSLNRLSDFPEETAILSKSIMDRVESLIINAKNLPPVDYSVAKDSLCEYSVEDKDEEIISASYSFGDTIIYKEKDFDTIRLTHYRSTIKRLNDSNTALSKECSQLRNSVLSLRHKQRNTLWVGILSVVIAILGGILYFKVINPSEVTHYETGEFVYYGPIKDGQPHGIGVAIYPSNDKHKRKYYYGNFENGIRSDTAAMLYYQSGNYFYGHIEDSDFVEGIQYVNSSNSYFRGTFDEKSKPYNGTWYDYEEAYKVVNGN